MELYRCRFIPFQPQSINALALSPPLHKCLLAVIRDNHTLEILDASKDWHTIDSIVTEYNVQVLMWLPSVTKEDDDAATVTASIMDTRSFLDTLSAECHSFKINEKHLWNEDEEKEGSSSLLPVARLFTAGSDGIIQEWSLTHRDENSKSSGLSFLRPINHIDSHGGGGITCMTHSPDMKRIIIGCEDGSCKVFRLNNKKGKDGKIGEEAFLIHEKTMLNPSVGRALCISWSKDGKLIAVGYEKSVIHIWSDYKSVARIEMEETVNIVDNDVNGDSTFNTDGDIIMDNTAIDTVNNTLFTDELVNDDKTEREKKTRKRKNRISDDTLVWSCAFLHDSTTLVSGNSLGKLQFWSKLEGDEFLWILQQTCEKFEADILSIVVHPNQDRIHATGVDHHIVELSKTGPKLWQETGNRRTHTHDIQSLSLGYVPCGRKCEVTKKDASSPSSSLSIPCLHLIRASGGIDSRVFLADYSNRNCSLERHLVPFPHKQICCSSKGSFIAANLGKEISIWSINPYPRQLVKFIIPRNEFVSCYSLFKNDYLAYSTPTVVKLFKLTIDPRTDGNQNLVERVALNYDGSTVKLMAFMADTNMLIIVSMDRLYCYSVSSGKLLDSHALNQSINFSPQFINCRKRWIAIAGLKKVQYFAIAGTTIKFNGEFQVPSLIVAISWTSKPYNQLLIATIDAGFLYLYSRNTKKLEPYWNTPPDCLSSPQNMDPILGISWRNNHLFTIWSHGYLLTLSLYRKETRRNNEDNNNNNNNAKEKRSLSNDKKQQQQASPLTLNTKYRPLIHFDWIMGQAPEKDGLKEGALVIERTWSDVVTAMPPPFDKKRWHTGF